MFSLPFTISENPVKIGLKDPIFFIGSCFSDNIGEKLGRFKFKVISNPFGTIYNPHSIFKNLRLAISQELDFDNHVKIRDIFYHWDTHSTLSSTSLPVLKDALKQKFSKASQSLANAEWLIITLGTAYAYKHIKNNEIVANCHKAPLKDFEKLMLSPSEIIAGYFETMKLIRVKNPNLKVILTVSPVRHIRDGLPENNVSKSTLLLSVSKIVASDPLAFYFPSYELMIDVLRDYRFYKEDMVHPSDQAITYIWQQFVETFFDHETQRFVEQWGKVLKSLNHKPFHPNSPDHQIFLKSTIKQLKALESWVDVSQELVTLQNQIIK